MPELFDNQNFIYILVLLVAVYLLWSIQCYCRDGGQYYLMVRDMFASDDTHQPPAYPTKITAKGKSNIPIPPSSRAGRSAKEGLADEGQGAPGTTRAMGRGNLRKLRGSKIGHIKYPEALKNPEYDFSPSKLMPKLDMNDTWSKAIDFSSQNFLSARPENFIDPESTVRRSGYSDIRGVPSTLLKNIEKARQEQPYSGYFRSGTLLKDALPSASKL